MIRDGWHNICATAYVFTESGMVLRATRCWRPASVYKWDAKLECWTNVCPVKYETFRKGYREGRYDIK